MEISRNKNEAFLASFFMNRYVEDVYIPLN